MIYDNAKPVAKCGDKFAAFVTHFDSVAVVQIYRRFGKYGINFQAEVANYETANKGATQSARKECKKLELEA